MCGRYTLVETKGLKKRFNTDNNLASTVRPNYNAAPKQYMPIIRIKDGRRRIEIMQWSLLPVWAKGNSKFKFSTFNAKAENLMTSGLWKKSFESRRCLVPATGFYEWKSDKDGKHPYYIKVKGRDIFSLAGIFDEWTDQDTGEIISSYTIITTTPNKDMKGIHDRMPVILEVKEEKDWLREDADLSDMMALLNPYKDKGLEMYEVDSAVGKVASQGIELTYPLEGVKSDE